MWSPWTAVYLPTLLFLVGVIKIEIKREKSKDAFIILANVLIIIKPGDLEERKRIVSINFNVIIRQKIMQPLRTV